MIYYYISLYPCISTISPYVLLLNALYKPSPKSPEVQEWLKARRTRWRWMSSKRSLEVFLGTEKDRGPREIWDHLSGYWGQFTSEFTH
jgi:hypothetical protein